MEAGLEKYGSLRAHQQEIANVAGRVARGQHDGKIVVAHVTPGGGKTMMASIYAHELIERRAVQRVLIVCPRDTLRAQVRDGFTDAKRGRPLAITIDASKSAGQSDLLGRVVGLATTYQAIVANPKKFATMLSKHRYLLVLDEAHHLAGVDGEDEASLDPAEDYTQWRVAISPLVDRATQVLVMTGTMSRSDHQPIPFVRYTDDGLPIADVRYTRRDALRERAVLPIEFTMWDGEATYVYRGREHCASLGETNGKERSRTLRTAITDMSKDERGEFVGYVGRFLAKAIGAWQRYRSDQYASRAIVVCYRQDDARTVARKIIPSIAPGVRVALAISDEKRAAKTICDFRGGTGDILVTVGMAYEGLDVPDATHLICLSNRRAKPWLEQTVARVTRVNQDPACYVKPSKQLAYVWAPNDVRMREFADTIIDEQDVPAVDRPRASVGDTYNRRGSSFEPGQCEITKASFADDVNGLAEPHENAYVDRIITACPELASLPHRRILEMSTIFRGIKKDKGNGDEDKGNGNGDAR